MCVWSNVLYMCKLLMHYTILTIIEGKYEFSLLSFSPKLMVPLHTDSHNHNNKLRVVCMCSSRDV